MRYVGAAPASRWMMVTLMKLSNGWDDFRETPDRIYPRIRDTVRLPLTTENGSNASTGLWRNR